MILLSLLKSLFRKLFSFYTLITSYKPTRGHHNLVISTKSLFRIISNSYPLSKLRRKSVKYRFCDNTCVSGFLKKKENLKSSVLSALTKYLS